MNLFRVLKTLLVLGIVFAAGIVIGGVGTARYIQREYRARLDQAGWTPRTMDWIRKSASLTEPQENEIRPVVDASIKKLAALQKTAEEERKLIVGELVMNVAEKLPSPQREQFAEACRAAAAKPSAWSQPLPTSR